MGSLQKIDHIVVLMLENRSFDSLLGTLYPKSDSFEGLNGSPPNCCTLDDVASCAAAGDAAKSNAEINASFFIGTSLSLGASQ